MDHMGSIGRASSTLRRGYGFGLNFAVHADPTLSGLNGSVGEYNWGGLAGTSFWIDPQEELIGIYMIQMMPPRFSNGPDSSSGWCTRRSWTSSFLAKTHKKKVNQRGAVRLLRA